MTEIDPNPQPKWSARGPILIGLLALVALVGGIGYWSVSTRLAGAVIASGQIVVESNRQVIQHPEGGVVGEIAAGNGDRVEEGAVLLRLDDTLLSSERDIILAQLNELRARKAMLEAERDDRAEVTFPEALLEIAEENTDVAAQVAGQERLFAARRQTLAQELSQIDEQVAQTENQIIGINAQIGALETQSALAESELVDAQSLFDRGLSPVTRVTELQREAAGLSGDIGRLTSEVAQLRGQIAALEIEKLKLVANRRREAIVTLRDIQFREIEFEERRLGLDERLSRLEVRAPVAGVIYGQEVFARKAVVQAGAPIMYIIPQDQPLVVQARIDSVHVDQVFQGQDASLRFTAFDQTNTPEVGGVVTEVSADVLRDEVTGVNFYEVELIPRDGELVKLEGQTLLPGMPVEAFLKTTERTPLSYLTKPLTDYFNRSLREG
ncbi:MAG: HlyD family type I secretion periplasmic adaptor subunit [Rhodobacteraceae bacterium]|nr:HlyD family type I secretion periplasmic adaptor subunit [Paracoccaceae bacterium]